MTKQKYHDGWVDRLVEFLKSAQNLSEERGFKRTTSTITDVRIYSTKRLDGCYKLDNLGIKNSVFGADTDIVIVTMKTPDGKEMNDFFPTLLKYEGILEPNAQSKVSILRRRRFIDFLQYYKITENVDDYNIIEKSKTWIGKEVQVNENGGICLGYSTTKVQASHAKRKECGCEPPIEYGRMKSGLTVPVLGSLGIRIGPVLHSTSTHHKGIKEVKMIKPDEKKEPLIDIFEERDHILVAAELSYVDKKDINFKITRNVLQLILKTPKEKIKKQIKIPKDSKINKIEDVSFKNHVLQIKLKKKIR